MTNEQLECSYCHASMDIEGDPVTVFMDGEGYSLVRVGTQYKCPQCGQVVEACEEYESERSDGGAWVEVEHRTWVDIKQHGEPFIVTKR